MPSNPTNPGAPAETCSRQIRCYDVSGNSEWSDDFDPKDLPTVEALIEAMLAGWGSYDVYTKIANYAGNAVAQYSVASEEATVLHLQLELEQLTAGSRPDIPKQLGHDALTHSLQ